MIDTIVLNFYNIEISESELATWDESISRRSGKVLHRRTTTLNLDNGAPVTISYYPYINGGKPLLKLEFSLPRVVMGTNIQMVYDIRGAVTEANARLKWIPFLAPLNLWSGMLARLDICYNHRVGDLLPYYIRALQHLEYKHRKTRPYSGEGVQYGNGSISTKFYDKFKESRDEAARGVLRQETTIRKSKLKALLGKKRPALRDITVDFLIGVLEGDLEELGLIGNSIATRKTALPELLDKYGEYGGMYHYGLLMARMEHPEEIVTRHSNMHPRKLDRRVKAVADAIGPVTVTEREEPLPPLLIDKEMVRRRAGEGGLCPKFMGDTYQPDKALDPDVETR